MYRLKSPLRGQLEITEACNNACSHCYNYWRYLETGERLDWDNRKRSFGHFENLLQILIDQGLRAITFTGGEPFLRRDILFPLIEKAREANLEVAINTNGALITEDDAERLKELEVESVLVSLLSYDEEKHNNITHSHNYQKTLQGIRYLAEAEQSFTVNMVTSQENWQQVRETAKLVSELGSKSFSATPVLACHLAKNHSQLNLAPEQVKSTLKDLVWAREELGLKVGVLEPLVFCMFTEEELEQFGDIIGSRYCSAGITDCVVSPDGNLRPCILSTDIGGNILHDGWEKPWDSLSKWKTPEMIPSDCLECTEVDLCGGGCRAAAKAYSGEFNGPDPFMQKPLHLEEKVSAVVSPHVSLKGNVLVGAAPGFGWRDEPFGGTLYRGEKYFFMKTDAFEFLKSLLTAAPFSVTSVSEKTGVAREDIQYFLEMLVNEGYLAVLEEDGNFDEDQQT